MANKKRKAAKRPDPAIPERTKNHRTSQNPWESSRDEEYEVVRVTANLKEYRSGQAYYLVEWDGDHEDTWEPVANLVHATQAVSKFNHAAKQVPSSAMFLHFFCLLFTMQSFL